MNVMSRGIHFYQLPILQQPNDAIGVLIRKCREQQIAVKIGLCLHKHSGTFNLLKHLGLFVVFKPAVIKKGLAEPPVMRIRFGFEYSIDWRRQIEQVYRFIRMLLVISDCIPRKPIPQKVSEYLFPVAVFQGVLKIVINFVLIFKILILLKAVHPGVRCLSSSRLRSEERRVLSMTSPVTSSG